MWLVLRIRHQANTAAVVTLSQLCCCCPGKDTGQWLCCHLVPQPGVLCTAGAGPGVSVQAQPWALTSTHRQVHLQQQNLTILLQKTMHFLHVIQIQTYQGYLNSLMLLVLHPYTSKAPALDPWEIWDFWSLNQTLSSPCFAGGVVGNTISPLQTGISLLKALCPKALSSKTIRGAHTSQRQRTLLAHPTLPMAEMPGTLIST